LINLNLTSYIVLPMLKMYWVKEIIKKENNIIQYKAISVARCVSCASQRENSGQGHTHILWHWQYSLILENFKKNRLEIEACKVTFKHHLPFPRSQPIISHTLQHSRISGSYAAKILAIACTQG
jgi:hypothetical protein